jgi:hypothetical protein
MTASSHAAPASTHARSVAISASGNCPLGGMCGSAPAASARISGLSAAFPGTTTGPFLPPFRAVSREDKTSSPLCLIGE